MLQAEHLDALYETSYILRLDHQTINSITTGLASTVSRPQRDGVRWCNMSAKGECSSQTFWTDQQLRKTRNFLTRVKLVKLQIETAEPFAARCLKPSICNAI